MNRDRFRLVGTLVPEEFRPTDPGRVIQLAGGSDRVFLRVPINTGSVVIMQATPADEEFEHYLAIQQYLAKRHLGVPEIYYSDPLHKVAVLEDLGNDSLELVARASQGKAFVKLYREVIEFLTDFQVKGFAEHQQCRSLAERSFDHTMLRWETWYARVYFLEQFCGLDRKLVATLTNEFEQLAQDLAGERQLLMHRDFQSQNIFIKDNRVRIVDFQAARRGIPTYDPVALVRDPYVALPYETGNDLLDYYRYKLAERGRMEFTDDYWHRLIFQTTIQRLLQALGAYSFLSLVKGRNNYREYIGPAFDYLQRTLDQYGRFPKLSHLILEKIKLPVK